MRGLYFEGEEPVQQVSGLWHASLRDILAIPRSRHIPKIAGFDDTEVVGDRVAERNPIFGNLVAREVERRIGELPACGVTSVVRDMPVHEAPQSLDWGSDAGSRAG